MWLTKAIMLSLGLRLLYAGQLMLILTEADWSWLQVVVGAAIPSLLWVGAKLFRGIKNHAHRDSSVRGFKVDPPV